MITEGYFAKIDEYPEGDFLVCVSRKYPWFVKKNRMEWLPDLAPTPQLLDDYKNNKIAWEEYVDHFSKEILWHTHPTGDLQYLRARSEDGENIRLLCYEKGEDQRCHRFLLLDMIRNLERW